MSNGRVPVFQADGASAANDEEPLPAGWAMSKAPNGRVFYIDHNTKMTTWVSTACWCPSIHLSNSSTIHLSTVQLSICPLPNYPFVHYPTIHLPTVNLFICPTVHYSLVHLSILSNCPFNGIYSFVQLSMSPFVKLFIVQLSIYPFAKLFINPFDQLSSVVWFERWCSNFFFELVDTTLDWFV